MKRRSTQRDRKSKAVRLLGRSLCLVVAVLCIPILGLRWLHWPKPRVISPALLRPIGPEVPFNDEVFRLIIVAEGTDRAGDPYDCSLAYFKPRKPLTSMTLDESLAWGAQVRKLWLAMGNKDPSSAKGAFQLENETEREAMRALGLTGREPFNPATQKKIAVWVARNQGLGAWDGFLSHPRELTLAARKLGLRVADGD